MATILKVQAEAASTVPTDEEILEFFAPFTSNGDEF